MPELVDRQWPDRLHRGHLLTLPAIWLAEGSLHWWKLVFFVHSWWKTAYLVLKCRMNGSLCSENIVILWRECHGVGRRGHHWSSLTETWQHSVTSMTCIQLSNYFSNSSHEVLFISMTVPYPIQPELCKTFLEPTNLICCHSLHARQTFPQ